MHLFWLKWEAVLSLSFGFTLLTAAQADRPQAVYDRGQNYWKLSREAFNDLQKTAPDSAYAFALRADDKAKKRQNTPAIEAYKEALKREPKVRGLNTAMADVYRASGMPGDASASEAAEQNLGPANCAVEKLWCDFSAGRFEEVVKGAKAKGGPEGLYWLARAYRELALQSFDELNDLPESSELHGVKARLLREEQKYEESAEEWRGALKLKPGDRNLQRELATTLYLSEKYQSILPELEQLLKQQPDSANLNFFVGDSFLQTEQAEKAVPYLEAALRLDPKLLPAHVSLGLCYTRLDEAEKAIPHLQAGLKLDTNGRLYYLLARAYRKTGQVELAKAMMEKYQQIQKASGGER